MKFFREMNFFNKNSNRLNQRKSVVGSFATFDKDIFRDKYYTPHEEMEMCVQMYNRNSYTQSAVNTMKDFIKGGNIIIKGEDEYSRKKVQDYFNRLGIDVWLDECIENTIKTGNGYLETNKIGTVVEECFAIADCSRIYINCDEFGEPLKRKEYRQNEYTKEMELIEVDNNEEFYIQRLNPAYKIQKAKWYSLSYQAGSMFRKFRIYGLPINREKIIHFKLNIGDTGIYGRSAISSSLDDFEILRQLERSLAVIAKYKAVPRDIIMYGDKDMPATDDETTDFIVYLESLQKDESAIVNKPIKREVLSYAGQDINLDYMIQHIKRKLIAGIAPDFMLGMDDTGGKNAQITLISYILAIYSKRNLFLKPIEKYILKPFIEANGLKHCWLEFGELDFETKNEKVNRVGALWTQNLITFNEARKMLNLSTESEKGDKYYIEWQNSMTQNLMLPDFGSGEENQQPDIMTPEEAQQMFLHPEAPNRKSAIQGGKMPFDEIDKTVKKPKVLNRDDMKSLGELR